MATPTGSWRDFLAGLAPVCEDGLPRLRPVGPGATAQALAQLESTAGVALPVDLRNLFAEMDGVEDVSSYLYLIMPVAFSLRDNDRIRKKEWQRDFPTVPPYDQLFFFAQWGNGDRFGFPVADGIVHDKLVLVWDHEDNALSPLPCTSLREFFVWWVNLG